MLCKFSGDLFCPIFTGIRARLFEQPALSVKGYPKLGLATELFDVFSRVGKNRDNRLIGIRHYGRSQVPSATIS
jgi:hypothetical protein